ncbi:hypothetical protein L596_019449 [Steinernema carpocapsae]|uniref:Cathepsin propeptide inhibitor domain-containing protein n=1 Tax=Steinernema carpocapsae TaxID=34508 RepID=A0A4U5MQJ6_STECR|nr:hypothetical protein L596_019449 [Steinernema carpocapsae]
MRALAGLSAICLALVLAVFFVDAEYQPAMGGSRHDLHDMFHIWEKRNFKRYDSFNENNSFRQYPFNLL